MTTIYGIVCEHLPQDDTVQTPFYLVPFQIVDVVRDETNRAPGTCFMQVICTANVPVPALGISAGQKLAFGRTVPIAMELSALLPFNTGFLGFQDVETGQIVGNGEFYETLATAKTATERPFGQYINLVP